MFSKVVVLPLAVYESSSCSTFLPTFDIVSLFNFNHSSGCVVVSHCGFNVHLWNN